jgi:hypothetical protein
MKMRWRIAFGAVGVVVLAAAVIVGVPSTRAAAGGFFAGVFNIDIMKSPQLGYLPEGFEPMPVYVAGSLSVLAPEGLDAAGDVGGMEVASSGAAREEGQALYQNGDRFLVVKTATDSGEPLPEGQATEVNGASAVLRTGLSGTVEPPGPPEGAEMGVGAETVVVSGGTTGAGEAVAPSLNVQGSPAGSAGASAESGTVVVQEPDDGTAGAPGSETQGTPPEIPSLTYDDANSLTWLVDGTRVEILTNLSVEELLKIAEGLVLPE